MKDLFILGGPLMYPLLFCLIVSSIIIIERSFFWLNLSKNRNLNHVKNLMKALQEEDKETIEKIVQNNDDVVVKIIHKVSLYPKDQLNFAMDLEVTRAFSSYKKYGNILDTIISISPLIGILGTVIGIIISFQTMAATGMEDPKAVTGGIGQALITTASGLGIAIFTLLAYNLFNARIEKITEEIESNLSELELIYAQKPLTSKSITSSFHNKLSQKTEFKSKNL